MARITKAELRAEGSGPQAVLTVVTRINWDRSDRDIDWQLVIRFLGADAVTTGGDDVLTVHTVPAPYGEDEMVVSIKNTDRVFDEDRGDDEIEAEVELLVRQPETKIVRTNKVKGEF